MLAGEKGALCLPCADLDHLVFLPSGDAALTRRAGKHSTLAAVVLKWSRARKRYERQGFLVEETASSAPNRNVSPMPMRAPAARCANQNAAPNSIRSTSNALRHGSANCIQPVLPGGNRRLPNMPVRNKAGGWDVPQGQNPWMKKPFGWRSLPTSVIRKPTTTSYFLRGGNVPWRAMKSMTNWRRFWRVGGCQRCNRWLQRSWSRLN